MSERAERRRSSPGGRAPAVTAPARGPAWPVVLLAVAGALVAGYLAVTKLSGGQALLCTPGGGCDIVQASRYAVFLGVPTALWGAAAYVSIAVLALLGLTSWRWLAALLVAVGGASFSAYLTYVSLFVLRATCVWCLTSLAIVLALVLALVWLRPPPDRRRSYLRPARIVPMALVAGVAAVAMAATFFASTQDPAVAAPFPTALARHLARTGGVMYGAFW